MAGTSYIVLKYDGGDGWLEHVARRVALSADAAIRAAVIANSEQATRPGTYVAVPARSWKPVQVSAVQTTVLKLEEATSKPAEPKAAA